MSRDGMNATRAGPASLALVAGISPYRYVVQVPGEGCRMPADALRETLVESAGLRGLLPRFAQALSVQTSCMALSNAVHPIDERLARWLLMCLDRVDGDELLLTDDFLSLMLAVRRSSVTTSPHVLEATALSGRSAGSSR
jgi:CRP-like cAMP-binding protein